jgi:hypothetical protein
LPIPEAYDRPDRALRFASGPPFRDSRQVSRGGSYLTCTGARPMNQAEHSLRPSSPPGASEQSRVRLAWAGPALFDILLPAAAPANRHVSWLPRIHGVVTKAGARCDWSASRLEPQPQPNPLLHDPFQFQRKAAPLEAEPAAPPQRPRPTPPPVFAHASSRPCQTQRLAAVSRNRFPRSVQTESIGTRCFQTTDQS